MLNRRIGDKNGPAARNLRKRGICFRREPANICTIRNEFFLNKVIPFWNELPQKVRDAKTLNCFKAGLDDLKSYSNLSNHFTGISTTTTTTTTTIIKTILTPDD
jgi:hypothetical protein